MIGTADHHYDAANLEEVRQATEGEAVVIGGADHGLEIPGVLVEPANAMAKVVAALQRFLGR